MATLSAPAQQMMSGNSMLVRQKLTLEELMLCGPSKYAVTATPDDWVDGEWDDDKMLDMAPKLMKSEEESEFMCRVCCHPQLYEMDIGMYATDTNWVANKSNKMYSYHRPPWKFGIPVCCFFMLCPPEIDTNNDQGQKIGNVVFDFRCMDALCGKAHWKVNNAQGQTDYVIEADACCNANMFAPSICCKAFRFQIQDAAETQTLGEIQNVFSCKLKRLCFSGLDQYKINYPANATPEQKATLLSAVFLFDYTVFAPKQDTG